MSSDSGEEPETMQYQVESKTESFIFDGKDDPFASINDLAMDDNA
jgi:hypothetical protein